ncbi:MAG: serine protease [Myxococcota bacterium]
MDYNTVRVERRDGGWGSGWLLAQSGRPLVVTNRHVVDEHRGSFRIWFYRGSTTAPVMVEGRLQRASENIDLALIRLLDDAPASAQAHRLRTDTVIRRGEEVILGGNPAVRAGETTIPLPFQTTSGVITGHVNGESFTPCGENRNCVVVDAASLRGSSGGPAFDLQGNLVGMLWGGPQYSVRTLFGTAGYVQNATISYLIHTRTLATELRRFERESQRRRNN